MTVEIKMRRRPKGTPPGIEILRLEAGPVWETLASTPGVGVSVVTDEPRVLWCNERAAVIFGGEGTDPAHFIGHPFADRFPPEWIEERMRVFARVMTEGEPVLLRTVWSGRQQVSWISHLGTHSQGDDTVNHFLVVTQRMDADQLRETILPEGAEVTESGVVRLGKLDRLTGRELEILALLGQGLTLKDIAALLHRSVKTIDNHRQSIGRKLHAADRTELVTMARHAGLTLADAQRKRV